MYNPQKQREKEKETMERLLNDSERFNVGNWRGHRFFPEYLNENEKQTLFNYVFFVGVSAFVQNPSPKLEKDIYDHLFGEDELYIVLNNPVPYGHVIGEARVIAFLSTRAIKLAGKKTLYISGICVDPAFQGRGLGRALMNEALKRGEYQASALRTQNPVMKESFDRTYGGFSHPNGATPPTEVLDMAQELADILKTKDYDYKSMVCKGVYGSCLYGIEPSSRSAYYDDKFNEIQKTEGDSILCVKTL